MKYDSWGAPVNERNAELRFLINILMVKGFWKERRLSIEVQWSRESYLSCLLRLASELLKEDFRLFPFPGGLPLAIFFLFLNYKSNLYDWSVHSGVSTPQLIGFISLHQFDRKFLAQFWNKCFDRKFEFFVKTQWSDFKPQR